MSNITLLYSLALFASIKHHNEIPTRQLIRFLDATSLDNHAKSLLLKILPLLAPQDRAWLKSLY